MTIIEYFNSTHCPHRPMSEQSADNASFHKRLLHGEPKRREQVEHDVVVVPSVERDVIASGFSNGAHHIDCLIAIERRDLNCGHILDFSKLPPERVGEQAPT